MSECPRIVIAATGSGCGKTSLAVALAALLRRRGRRVQTFKVGPDFLDPTYLAVASGRTCYNLDGWMAGREYVTELFERATRDADFAIIEGVMGLFDGASTTGLEGSTAEIAQWLGAPVILIVNAHGASRSLAATVKGFATFEDGVSVAGVIANHCGSQRHVAGLKESLVAASLPPLVGGVARGALPALPSRHLGLVTADASVLTDEILSQLADAAEQAVDVGALLRLASDLNRELRIADCGIQKNELITGSADALVRSSCAFQESIFKEADEGVRAPGYAAIRIGLAYDRACHFYYPDNLEALEHAGCELVYFSPIEDREFPNHLDGLYLGGGYPEEHAAALAANAPMLDALRRFAVSGRPVYAECGGLMLLSRGVETLDGQRHALAGVLPTWTRMLPKRKALGYVEVTLTEDSLFGPRGTRLRGHEFHYSELIECGMRNAECGIKDNIYSTFRIPHPAFQSPYLLQRRSSGVSEVEGFQCGNVFASYVHAHFASAPGAVEHFVERGRRARHERA